MLKNMKIKTRLLFAFSVMIIITLIIAGIGVASLSKANRHLHDFMNKQYQADTAVKMCRIEANNAARTIRDMMINTDTSSYPDYETRFNASVVELEKNLDILKNTYTENDGLVEKYDNAINRWIEIGNRALTGLKAGQREEVRDILINECSPALEVVVSIAKELDLSTNELKEKVLEDSLSSTNGSAFVMLAAMVASVIFGIVISLRITYSIIVPLDEMKQAVNDMSEGILSAEIKYTGKDALGQMADSMRKSFTILSGYITDIDRAMTEMANGNFNVKPAQPFIGDFKHIEDSITEFVEAMSTTLRQINESADQVACGAGQVSDTAQLLSQGAEEQSAVTEELTGKITRIAEQIRQSAQEAAEASQRTEHVGQEIMMSNQQMQDMQKAMDEINESSKEIGKIIKAIEDIAFQTNILALNAAVEAARAGAAGKGFAVVADEVRNLASKSAEASKSTSQLIAGSLKAVENGTRIANETAGSLLNVVDGAREVVKNVDLISKRSGEQAADIEQVANGVIKIASVVQQNSATAEESAASSEEMSGQSQVLKSLVGKFSLKQ